MMGNPTVSVVIPVYNAESFIAETVESVLRQTFADFEIVIVDDASTDGTRGILTQIAKRNAHVRIVHNKTNLGVSKSRNRGIALSRGKYIALLDSDDLWVPDKLQRQVELIEASDADIVYCSYGMIDENGVRRYNDFIVPESIDFTGMLARSVMSCSTVLVRSEVFLKYDFDGSIVHEDYVLWLQLLSAGYRAIGDTKVLAQYRVRATSRSGNKLRSAWNRWLVYRHTLEFNFFRSLYWFTRYSLAGIKKYL